MSEDQRLLRVDIVAPDKRVFEGYAIGLRAPGIDGSFQILYNHAPMIASLNVGSLVLTLSGAEKVIFATSGGFIEVIGNVVTVLAETAEPASDIDTDRAQKAEQRALQRLQNASSDLDRIHAERALERARNRLRISMTD
ncbi:MAG: F0F1 ATP synthase subunit epsilon [Bacteroidetes bacterium]|nr:F0F1 ATP synthase subunit epsilon [Bacteroidota bacterium]MCY4204359.1 F0F1 ATP synthase subunit epsilon [Bacteroidota bacterium]